MIYITLTDFYNNFYINQSVFRLYKEHPDMFKEPTAIVGSSGSFPFNYWNGGYNSNEGKFLLKVEYEDLERNTYMPIRLDYSNIFLDVLLGCRDNFSSTVARFGRSKLPL